MARSLTRYIPDVARNAVLARILALAGIAGVAFGLTVPFLTLVARDRGVSLQAIGVMASSYLVAQMLLQLPFGALSDRIGRMLPIAIGFLLEGVATAGFAFADTTSEFIALRVLQGVSLAFLMPALRALIADITPVDQRGQAFAWLFACFSAGLLLGPPVGGLLAGPLGRNPLFLIAAAFNAIMAISAFITLRGAGGRSGDESDERKIPYRTLLARPLIAAFILGFGSRILEGMFAGIWSIYLDDLGASDMVIGFTFSTYSIAFLVATPWGGKLADRRPRWPRILAGNLVLASLIIAYGAFQWIPAILVLGLLEGAVSTVTIPALDAYLASVADPRIQGRVQGAFATIGTLGAAVAAFAGTLLYDLAHFLPFLAAGSMLIVITLVAIGLVRDAEQMVTATGEPVVAVEPAVAADVG